MTIDLDRPYPVTATQIAAFRRDGFIRLKEVFSAEELARYGPAITRLTIDLNTQTLPLTGIGICWTRARRGPNYARAHNGWIAAAISNCLASSARWVTAAVSSSPT